MPSDLMPFEIDDDRKDLQNLEEQYILGKLTLWEFEDELDRIYGLRAWKHCKFFKLDENE